VENNISRRVVLSVDEGGSTWWRHECQAVETPTPMPVIHSVTGSYARFVTGTPPPAAAAAIHVRTSLAPTPASSVALSVIFTSVATSHSANAAINARSHSGLIWRDASSNPAWT